MNDALPYLTPPADVWDLEPWLIGPFGEPGSVGGVSLDAASWEELGSAVAGWDYNTPLALRRRVVVDVVRAVADMGLPPGTPLGVSVTWRVTPIWTSGAAGVERLPSSSEAVAVLIAEPPSGMLSGLLRLSTRLVLAENVPDAPTGAPKFAGSVLLEDDVATGLQGAGARFPSSLVDFAVQGLDPDAWWCLEVDDDLGRAAMGAVQLLLNQDRAEIRQIASDPATDPALVERLQADVAAQLVRLAVRRSEELASVDLEPGHEERTLGASLSALVRRVFAGEEPESLAGLQATDPGMFEARLQGALRRAGRKGWADR